MSTVANGHTVSVSLPIYGINPVPSVKDGKYYVKSKTSQYNEKGRYGFTEGQLRNIANNLGFTTSEALINVVNADQTKSVKMTLVMEFCKNGEASPDNPTVTYKKDWWKINEVVVAIPPQLMGTYNAMKLEKTIEREAETFTSLQGSARTMAAMLSAGGAATANDESDPFDEDDDAEGTDGTDGTDIPDPDGEE